MKNLIASILQSSQDPTKTSATITGVLIAFSSWLQGALGPYIPFISNFYHSTLGMQSNQICTGLGIVIGGTLFLFGLFRKGVVVAGRVLSTK